MVSTLRGQVDSVDRGLIRGWAQDRFLCDQRISLLVTVNGTLVGRTIADRYRADLEAAGIGDGRHAFALALGNGLSPLSPHQIRVVRESDGTELDRSPWLLEPATSLDDSALLRLAPLLADGVTCDRTLLDRRLGFLFAQIDRLLGLRAAPEPDDPAAGWQAVRLGGAPDRPDAPDGRLALVIDARIPDGRRDAGSCALLSHMAALRRLGYRVLFAPTDPGDSSDDQAARARLAADQVTLCAAPFYASLEEVLRRHGSSLGLVYLHRGATGFLYARLVRAHCPRAWLICSMADLEHLRLARQCAVEGRPELARLAQRSRQREFAAAMEADLVLVHSAAEASVLKQALPGLRIVVAPWAIRSRPVVASFEARRGLAFLADYAHAPNLDAARRLIRDIMPLVWESEPEMTCLLAGSHLPPGLTGEDPRLVPVGHVPDLGRLFSRVRLTVAPLAYGAGIKGKVMESVAAGVPCVCTPIAAEGFDWPLALRRWIAPDTHGVASSILALHRDRALNAETARAGLAWAAESLSEAALDRSLGDAVRRGAPQPRVA